VNRIKDILSPLIRTEINPRKISPIKDINLKLLLLNTLNIIKDVSARYRYLVMNIPTMGLFLKGPVSLPGLYFSYPNISVPVIN